jgi:hypothetical protein
MITTDRYPIVILDASVTHAASLVEAMHLDEPEAIVFQTKQKLLEFVEKRQVYLGILVLHSKAWWKQELRLFCNAIRHRQENPELKIRCILTWPPKDREEEDMDRISGAALRTDVRHES